MCVRKWAHLCVIDADCTKIENRCLNFGCQNKTYAEAMVPPILSWSLPLMCKLAIYIRFDWCMIMFTSFYAIFDLKATAKLREQSWKRTNPGISGADLMCELDVYYQDYICLFSEVTSSSDLNSTFSMTARTCDAITILLSHGWWQNLETAILKGLLMMLERLEIILGCQQRNWVQLWQYHRDIFHFSSGLIFMQLLKNRGAMGPAKPRWIFFASSKYIKLHTKHWFTRDNKQVFAVPFLRFCDSKTLRLPRFFRTYLFQSIVKARTATILVPPRHLGITTLSKPVSPYINGTALSCWGYTIHRLW